MHCPSGQVCSSPVLLRAAQGIAARGICCSNSLMHFNGGEQIPKTAPFHGDQAPIQHLNGFSWFCRVHSDKTKTHAHTHAQTVNTHTCTHALTHAHTHTHTRTVNTHARTHARTHTHTHTRAHTHARTVFRTAGETCCTTHARTHARTHACTHARTHTHTHTPCYMIARGNISTSHTLHGNVA